MLLEGISEFSTACRAQASSLSPRGAGYAQPAKNGVVTCAAQGDATGNEQDFGNGVQGAVCGAGDACGDQFAGRVLVEGQTIGIGRIGLAVGNGERLQGTVSPLMTACSCPLVSTMVAVTE